MTTLYKVRGATWFSALDVRSGYHHIKVKKADQNKTCFIDGDREGKTYIWKRMCFEFKNAPAMFQRAMDKIFGHLDYVVVYIDDIIICSKDLAEHTAHLKEVFDLLSKHKLKLRLEKCQLFQKEIKYLGNVVTEEGIKADRKYVDQVIRLKRPESSKEVERYFGMVQWLGRFIPNISKLLAPITDLRKKDGRFFWTQKH